MAAADNELFMTEYERTSILEQIIEIERSVDMLKRAFEKDHTTLGELVVGGLPYVLLGPKLSNSLTELLKRDENVREEERRLDTNRFFLD